MPTRTFKYDPLPTQGPVHIRLIELLPTQGPISCRLHHVLLQSKRAYEALSYCWGTNTRTIPIEVNGATFNVRMNLHDALLRLRNSNSSRWLWVDAVCINQATNHDATQERTQQVQQMSSIYRNAVRVVIWLGNQSHPSINALDVVRELADYVIKRETDFPWLSQGSALGIIPQFPHMQDKRFVPFLKLIFDHPWFHRAWIIQELSVNKSHIVVYGDDEVEWSLFEASTRARGAVPDPIKRLIAQRQAWKRHDAEDLAMLFLRHREALATDPRDKLFALCGLVNGGNLFGTTPDYGLSVEDVFQQFTIRHIKETRTLDLICANTLSRSRQLNRPTWVVNEAFSPDDDSPSRALLTWRSKINPALLPCRATRGSRWVPAFSKNERLLITQGYIIDHIAAIGRPYQQQDPSLPGMRVESWVKQVEYMRIHTSWQGIVKQAHHNRYGPMGISSDDVFVQTCLAPILRTSDFGASRSNMHNVEFEYYREAFHIVNEALSFLQAIPSLLQGWAMPYHLALVWTLLASYFRYRGNRSLFEQASLQFHKCIYYCIIPASIACQGRRMFRTASGYVGMGPASLKTGDCVALMAGASVPVVLRQVGAEWQWLGESYVHGGMAGELWDEGMCHEMRIR